MCLMIVVVIIGGELASLGGKAGHITRSEDKFFLIQ